MKKIISIYFNGGILQFISFILLSLSIGAFATCSTSRGDEIFETRINSNIDDAEEDIGSFDSLGNGSVNLTSSDIELGEENHFTGPKQTQAGHGFQISGLHFRDVNVPRGAKIVSAYVEFRVDEATSVKTTVNFFGEDADNATEFNSTPGNLKNRVKTTASVKWNVPVWNTINAPEQSPDLSTIIQEIIDKQGWDSGNAINILINGCGRRVAKSYDRNSQEAPLLHIQWRDLNTTVFAIIGDYGDSGIHEREVADLVKGWFPDFIITTGDNNYLYGQSCTLDDNIGKYYADYIGNYQGVCGDGAETNRFFPCLGNHDWNCHIAPNPCNSDDCSMLPEPYLAYFTLPGNERYYDLVWENIHFFALSTDSPDDLSFEEPDGTDVNSVQAQWLRSALDSSNSQCNVVYLHLPPFASGIVSDGNGSHTHLQWPFEEWGADVVIAGHNHAYERIIDPVTNFPYFVNGLGGQRSIDNFAATPIPGSELRFNGDYGAQRVTVTSDGMTFEFIDVNGNTQDMYFVSCDVLVTWIDTVGVDVDGNTITKTAPNGWGNGGAASLESFTGDGGVEFIATQTNTYRMCGLSSINTDANWASIEYAIFLLNNGQIMVFESGVNKGSFVTYQIGDRFSVERIGSTIVYKKNDVIFYTSATPTDAGLLVDCAIQNTGGKISDVKLLGSNWIP
jgi:hypothetical protein